MLRLLITFSEKVRDLGQHRSTSLEQAQTYRAESLRGAKFELEEQTKRAIDSMPLFTKPVASKMASRAMEMMRYACLNSIKGEIEGIEGMGSEEMITFAETQKETRTMTKIFARREYYRETQN